MGYDYNKVYTVRYFKIVNGSYVSAKAWEFKCTDILRGRSYGCALAEDAAYEEWMKGSQPTHWLVVFSNNPDTFDVNDVRCYTLGKMYYRNKHRNARTRTQMLMTPGNDLNTSDKGKQLIATNAIVEE